jgi:hypothetical protein
MPTRSVDWDDQAQADHDQHLNSAVSAISSAAASSKSLQEGVTRLHGLGADVTALSAGIKGDWLDGATPAEMPTHAILESVAKQGQAILQSAPPTLSKDQLQEHHDLLDNIIGAIDVSAQQAEAVGSQLRHVQSHLQAMRDMWSTDK